MRAPIPSKLGIRQGARGWGHCPHSCLPEPSWAPTQLRKESILLFSAFQILGDCISLSEPALHPASGCRSDWEF